MIIDTYDEVGNYLILLYYDSYDDMIHAMRRTSGSEYDIKEKYGELRIEVNIASHYVNKVIEKYEYISYRTCGICGLPADKLSDGWIFPYCKKCADETTVIGFEDFEDWYGYKKFNK